MYTITTTPGGRFDTADSIPDALAVLGNQLTAQLPDGPVAWNITDPGGTQHRGYNALNGRLDLLTTAIDELVDELYTQLHRAADGGPRCAPRPSHSDEPTTVVREVEAERSVPPPHPGWTGYCDSN